MALTAKQSLFVKHYLISLNATDAALQAGYSEKTAKEMGYENLTKPLIAKAISKALDERSKRVEWTADEILRDLKEIATDRLVDFQHRLRAYELGGKHNAMWREKVEHSGMLGVNIINDIPKRTT